MVGVSVFLHSHLVISSNICEFGDKCPLSRFSMYVIVFMQGGRGFSPVANKSEFRRSYAGSLRNFDLVWCGEKVTS